MPGSSTHMEKNPPTSSERRACGTFRIPLIQPSQLGQPSQPSQPSQPGRPASQASWASKPQASWHRCQQFFFIGAPASLLRVPQAATGRHRGDSLLAPTAPGGAAKHATNPSNIDDMATFPTNRVMGRLWDDHFMALGYPSKFYRVQDAISIDGSSI